MSVAMLFMTENRKPKTGNGSHDLWHRRGPGEGGPDRAGPGALRRPLLRPRLHRTGDRLLPGQALGRKRASPCASPKEAFSKALGVGLRKDGIRWREVEVIPNALGKPDIFVGGRAAALCEAAGIDNMHLSLTDEDGRALAVVILER